MAKVRDQAQAEQFLKGLGLRKGEGLIRTVVLTSMGRTGRSLYDLYAHGQSRDGSTRAPICGKGTVQKIVKLMDEGRLDPYLSYLNSEMAGTADDTHAAYAPRAAHLSMIARSLRSPHHADLLRVPSPENIVGGPGHLKVELAASSLDHWEATQAVRWAREHVPGHRAWELVPRVRKALEAYRSDLRAVEQRAIEEATSGGLVAERENTQPNGSFTSDLWGAPLRWALRSLFGHEGEEPRAVIDELAAKEGEKSEPLYALFWTYSRHGQPHAPC